MLSTGLKYRPTTAHSAQEALDFFHKCEYVLVIVFHPLAVLDEFVHRCKLIDSAIPILLVSPESVGGSNLTLCDSWLYRPTTAETLERIHVMSSRKRGPKRGYKKPPAAEELFILSSEKVG